MSSAEARAFAPLPVRSGGMAALLVTAICMGSVYAVRVRVFAALCPTSLSWDFLPISVYGWSGAPRLCFWLAYGDPSRARA